MDSNIHKSKIVELLEVGFIGILVVIGTSPGNDWSFSTGIDPPLSWVFNYIYENGLNDKNQWNNIYNSIDYKHVKPNCILKAYLWNKSDEDIYIDNFRLLIMNSQKPQRMHRNPIYSQ